MRLDQLGLRIEDREDKRLRGKKIVLVKVILFGPTGESATWESEGRMKELYPKLFPSGNFRGKKFFLVEESCNRSFLAKFILLYVFVCFFVYLSQD